MTGAGRAGEPCRVSVDGYHDHQVLLTNVEARRMAEPSSALIATPDQGELFQASRVFDDHNSMEACFKAFDKDSDGLLTLSDFASLCRALFRNDQGKAYSINEKHLQDMFDVFDLNEDGYIDSKEFRFCWQRWIKPIVRPCSALIVVDVQNDFISGSLSISKCPAKQNGEDVVAPINHLLDTVAFESVFYSLDWHPENHVSFVENINLRKLHTSSKVRAHEAKILDTVIFEGPPLIQQKLWPRHCVQNSWGAEFHPDLKVVDSGVMVYKGSNPDVDSYSAFWDNNKVSQTNLSDLIREKKVTDLYVCGIAYDVCVGATAKHAVEQGYRTILVEDACRGVSMEDMTDTRNTLAQQYAAIVHSSQVKAMAEGQDRRPDLGYFSAMRLRRAPENDGRDWKNIESTADEQDAVIFMT